MAELVIFDFDGVIADSERLANSVLAEELTAIGLPTTTDEAIGRYMGRRWADCAAAIEAHWGRPLPADFGDGRVAAMEARIEAELGPVSGVADFLDSLGEQRRCVASSSSPAWLAKCLARFGLAHHFGDGLYSAAVHVSRGKPHPDLFLHAASAMGVAPAQTLVIEDSVPGVTAGIAAGMTVVGLTAGSHCGEGYADRLRMAGAHHVARGYDEVSAILGGW